MRRFALQQKRTTQHEWENSQERLMQVQVLIIGVGFLRREEANAFSSETGC